jgi:hypothetical protein
MNCRDHSCGHPPEPGASVTRTGDMSRREFVKTATAGVAGFAALATSPKSAAAQGGGGLPMPSLEDERNTYRSWGWTWTAAAEPNYPSDPGFVMSDPDIHDESEGDDLWTSLMMYRRTGQQGYLHRAQAWANYFKNNYRACVGSSSFTYCYDRDVHGLDHMYGWGLVAWSEHSGDAAALTEAVNLAAAVEPMWSGRTPGQYDMGTIGLRQGGRHLLLVARVAERTGDPRWATLRNKLTDLWLQSPSFDAVRGMYFVDAATTNTVLGSGAYASGVRLQSAFYVGILCEAFYQVCRTTNRTDVRDRLVAMARFVDQYGLDATYQYTGSWFGHRNGAPVHSYSYGGSTSFWEPVYTTSLVNTLICGYKFTGDRRFYDRAKYFLNRGTKGVSGSSTQRAAGDTQVHHFIDNRFGPSNLYYYYNKGELQYAYQLFENGGLPDTVAPSAPPGLQVR